MALPGEQKPSYIFWVIVAIVSSKKFNKIKKYEEVDKTDKHYIQHENHNKRE